jgi:GH25 family lysozyme M1 (1,4-beta-N-acetylmuramidase)
MRPSSSRLRHRIAAAATTFTLAGGVIAAGTASAQAQAWQRPGARGTAAASATHTASTTSSASASPRFTWARTVTGREVRIPRSTFATTPIHPEKITHPGRDFAGSTVAAHFHGRAVQPTAGTNAITHPPGIDVSAYQGDIGWSHVCPYIDFSYAKATEGTYYTNPDFYNQYEGPYNCGVIRGAYHFAIPSNSAGWVQARYFVEHGGGWSGDGKTLPGALDIEYNPYRGSNECYGLSPSSMVTWIKSFVDSYARRTGVYPVIYTTTNWWSTCTRNSGAFGNLDPLWIANYTDSNGGPLPHGWGFWTFWQYRDSGSLPGDQDVFNGAKTRLRVLAKNG